jgi:hypothetical protein
MITPRELGALAAAGCAGFVAFLLVNAGYVVYLRDFAYLRAVGFFGTALHAIGPVALGATLAAAPALVVLHRRRLLNIGSAAAVFAACVVAATLVSVGGDLQELAATRFFHVAVAEHGLFALAAGATYWAIVVLPSGGR